MSSPAAAARPRRTQVVGAVGATLSTALDALWLTLAIGGWRALLAHPRALGLLAVWWVGALILGAARPVRARAGTRRTSDPILLAALLVLPLAAPPLAAWGERLGVWVLPGGEARGWAGVALAAAGLALRIAAMVQLGSRFHPTVAILSEHALETRGPYSRIRHPGYAGAWLAALGGVLAFGSALGLAPVALMGVALAARVRSEERVLAEHFGESYREYRTRTGAFLPRF